MKKKGGSALLKWAALFVLAFVLSVPAMPVTSYAANTYTVTVASGYLALRNGKAFDSKNEVGKLYSGDTVQVANREDATYWLVYAPGLGKGGYVNKDYLIGGSTGTTSTAGDVRTVSVASGYLALRNAKAYDKRNEIGQLYTGDTVTVQDASDATYWYVYSPKYNCSGYVNKDYLY